MSGRCQSGAAPYKAMRVLSRRLINMQKVLCFLVASCVAPWSFSQNVLFSNAENNNLTGDGLWTRSRPAGGFYSEIQGYNTVAGFRGSIEPGANDRLADDFCVGGFGWRLLGASLFMYETDVNALSIYAGLFEVRQNLWGVVGPLVATGSFVSSSWTDTYRIFKNAPADNRRIQKVDVAFDVPLPSGKYYLVWATKGAQYKTGPWNPYLTGPGITTLPGANAKYSLNGGATYDYIQDGLANQDFPFVLYGSQNSNSNYNHLEPPR